MQEAPIPVVAESAHEETAMDVDVDAIISEAISSVKRKPEDEGRPEGSKKARMGERSLSLWSAIRADCRSEAPPPPLKR